MLLNRSFPLKVTKAIGDSIHRIRAHHEQSGIFTATLETLVRSRELSSPVSLLLLHIGPMPVGINEAIVHLIGTLIPFPRVVEARRIPSLVRPRELAEEPRVVREARVRASFNSAAASS